MQLYGDSLLRDALFYFILHTLYQVTQLYGDSPLRDAALNALDPRTLTSRIPGVERASITIL